MTLLMFLHDDTGFRIMTDTLETTVEGEAFSFVDKCFAFPSRDMVVASTGVAALVTEWVDFLRTRTLALDHTQIDAHAPAVLREMWARITAQAPNMAATATIYHFGIDFHTRETILYTYRSTKNFESERVTQPGFGIDPEPDGYFDVPESDQDWLTLAQRVRTE